MNHIKRLMALWLCLASLTRAGGAPPIGLVVYCEPPRTYRLAKEFVGIQKAEHFSKLINLNGVTEEIPTAGILGIIMYPSAGVSVVQADEAIKQLQTLLPQTSEREAKSRLETTLVKWTNARAVSVQKLATPQAPPAEKQEVSRTLTIDGVKYSDVTLTAFVDGLATITHSDGILKVEQEKLTRPQVDLLNRTSRVIRIVMTEDVVAEATKLSSNSEGFVALLNKYPSRFPLTAFSMSLKTRDWPHALSVSKSASAKILARYKAFGDSGSLLESPLIYVAAGQAGNREWDSVIQTLKQISPLGQKALALRVVTEWALQNGDAERAEWAATCLEADWDNLPESDRAKLRDRDAADTLSSEALTVVGQHAIAHRLLVAAFAERGSLKEARFWMKGIRDRHQLLKAHCSILEAMIASNDPEANQFSITLVEKLENAGLTWEQTEVFKTLAQARGQRKEWTGAFAALDKALTCIDSPSSTIPPTSTESFRTPLILERAKIQRLKGDMSAASMTLSKLLAGATASLDYETAIKARGLDRDQAGASIHKIVESIATNVAVDQSARSQKLWAVALAQRRAKDVEGARDTLTKAVALLGAAHPEQVTRGFICEEQARVGQFSEAEKNCDLVKEPSDKRRFLLTIAIERAKRQQLKEAIETVQKGTISEEELDVLGAAVLGVLDGIDPFPYLTRITHPE